VRPGNLFVDAGVLVTGAQGFIGSWLAERLLGDGARVVVPRRDFDPDSRFRLDGIDQRCEIVAADVLDYEALLSIIAEYRIKAVFHLAAQPIVAVANRSPLSTFESNVRGTYTVLEACRAAGVVGEPIQRVVVASSDHAYGSHGELPYREDAALAASYPYDVSKACADTIARSYAATYELPVAVTRIANCFGGGDRNFSRIVPDTVRSLIRGERPVIRSDGTPQRDYLYVEDAVEVYLTVAASLSRREMWGRAWNAGLGRPISVLELVRRLIAVSGRDVEPEVLGSAAPKEVDRQFPDSSAIREELGWRPRWELDDGLRRTFDWYARLLGEAAPIAAGAERPG
jgi:CDP-glucose 4,6-dehydratase